MVDIGFFSDAAVQIDNLELDTGWFEQNVRECSDANVVDLTTMRHDVLLAVFLHG